jgi:hypothetical protein
MASSAILEDIMVFQPCPNIASVTVTYLLTGLPVCNVFHVKAVTDGVAPDVSVIAETFVQWVAAQALPLMTTDVMLSSVVARDLTTDMSPVHEAVLTGEMRGSVSDSPLPANVAFVVTSRTALPGRSARGRTYLAGLPRQWVATSRTYTPAHAAEWIDAFESLRNGLLGLQYNLVVLSRQHAKVVLPQGVAYPITTFSTRDNRLDSQRRRLG